MGRPRPRSTLIESSRAGAPPRATERGQMSCQLTRPDPLSEHKYRHDPRTDRGNIPRTRNTAPLRDRLAGGRNISLAPGTTESSIARDLVFGGDEAVGRPDLPPRSGLRRDVLVLLTPTMGGRESELAAVGPPRGHSALHELRLAQDTPIATAATPQQGGRVTGWPPYAAREPTRAAFSLRRASPRSVPVLRTVRFRPPTRFHGSPSRRASAPPIASRRRFQSTNTEGAPAAALPSLRRAAYLPAWQRPTSDELIGGERDGSKVPPVAHATGSKTSRKSSRRSGGNGGPRVHLRPVREGTHRSLNGAA